MKTYGTERVRQDACALHRVMLAHSMLSAEVLNGVLKILGTVDLHVEMVSLQVPLLCIYDALDGLVPYKIATLLDQRWSSSLNYIVEKAAHALLISHPEAFCRALLLFV